MKTVGSFCFLNLTPNHQNFCNLLWIYLETLTSCKSTNPALPTKPHCECKDGVRAIWTICGLELPKTSISGQELFNLDVQIAATTVQKLSLKRKAKAMKSPLKSKGFSFLLICFASLEKVWHGARSVKWCNLCQPARVGLGGGKHLQGS